MSKRAPSSERRSTEEPSATSHVGTIARELLVHAPERLIELVEQQARRIEEQDQQLSGLQGQIAELEERFEQLARQSKRGAAPFALADDKRKKDKKRPGRKPGHRGRHRQRPSDAAVNRHVYAALTHCPHCCAPLDKASERAIEQTIIEVPPVKPEVIRLTTYRNHCHGCDKKVASNYPLQVSTASGAAGTRLGPRALAIAASLNKALGLTLRKTCQVLRQLLGIDLTPGGLSQALARMAGRLQSDYPALLQPVFHFSGTAELPTKLLKISLDCGFGEGFSGDYLSGPFGQSAGQGDPSRLDQLGEVGAGFGDGVEGEVGFFHGDGLGTKRC